MAAFERVRCGIPEMDKALDNIRLGDNVVFRVSNLDEFKLFMLPYVEQAKLDKRNIIYFRFASHEPLVEDCEEVKRIDIPLSHRFETFTVEIHNAIEREGYDAFYVFDCLSELQTAWATDLMMGNFFRVTCPFLFILDTVAFFPIIRGKHSVHAINKIINTTQLFLDVYSDKRNVYLRPEKVWERSSETMFLPHIYNPENGHFRPIMDGVASSRFYQTLGRMQRSSDEQHTDSWDRFFSKAMMLHDAGADIDEYCDEMCRIMMTRDNKLREMVRKHFTAEDYFEVRNHMIGTGFIGGKACGMLLARAIVRNECPDVDYILEPHDSFYIGSDVYYTYIVDNGFWDIRIKQRTEEGYFELADEFADRLKNGSFSANMETRLRRIIEYYGQDPYIVRSSSILEDGFGNAFAGKYESVFCANRGTVEERLAEFEEAIKTVYASTMSLSALDYRKRRGLDKRDEQMALLVQRVSGSYYGNYYMPCAAGVGYSYSPYKFLDSIDQSAGMLRLVMGLGTSAVDRNEGAYPRLVSLDVPEKTVYTNTADKHKYSQRKIEAVNVVERELSDFGLDKIEESLPYYLKNILLEHDIEAEQRLRDMGRNRKICFISCRGIVKNKEIMDNMRSMMACIQKEYDYPVDIEYSINLSDTGDYSINLLQCRPLQIMKDNEGKDMTEGRLKEMLMEVLGDDGADNSDEGNIDADRRDRLNKDKEWMEKTDSETGLVPGKKYVGTGQDEKVRKAEIILESHGVSMGLSRCIKLDAIVYVDPVGYYNLPYVRKNEVARMISFINGYFREKRKHIILMVPGRIGTSSPELGVPTSFYDISEFDAICEMEEKNAGYNPELSYGSHIFQDLVEADILYTAIFDNDKVDVFVPEKLENCPIMNDVILEGKENLKDSRSNGKNDIYDIVKAYDVSGSNSILYHNLKDGHLIVTV